MAVRIRPEQTGDEAAIGEVIVQAFRDAEHSNGNEAAIVAELRRAGALIISLVAREDEDIVGHVAFSPVTIDGTHEGWFGLGPVAVKPAHQRRGIGTALIDAGLSTLRAAGASGCVVLGDPAYYRRFGFADTDLNLPGAPPDYFQALAFDRGERRGTVAYHPAFGGG